MRSLDCDWLDVDWLYVDCMEEEEEKEEDEEDKEGEEEAEEREREFEYDEHACIASAADTRRARSEGVHTKCETPNRESKERRVRGVLVSEEGRTSRGRVRCRPPRSWKMASTNE